MVSHGGGWIGWSTLMTMLPERDVGVAVFTNRDASPVPDILTNYVFDRYAGESWCLGSIAIVSGVARPWRSSTLTGRHARRRGGRTRDQAMSSPTMPATTTIPATVG